MRNLWSSLVWASAALVLGGCVQDRSDASAPAVDRGLALETTADLVDKRIGVLLGSAHDTYATTAYPAATILQYQNSSDLVLAVMTGKVDAGLSDAEPLREIMRQNDALAVLGEPVFASEVAAGFRKTDPQLREQFNAFLAGLRQSGVYDEMIVRWFREIDSPMPEIDLPNAQGDLIVGSSVESLPFAAIRDGEPVGFDIEMVERFGAYLGRRVRFSEMEFGGLIAALAAGKIEMIVASMFITEERLERIDFSDPYFLTNSQVYVLRRNLGAAAGGEGSTAGGLIADEPLSFAGRVVNSFESNILRERRYLLVWDGLKTTVFISIFATLFGTALGALICFMRMSKSTVLSTLARTYIAVLRGTPVLVLLMLIFYVIFASVNISPTIVAIVAFGMNFAAYAAEIYRTGIEGVDRGQSEAGIAMGFTPARTFLYIVLPQTVQRILPVYKGEVISLVKMTSIVGYIAVQDLTKASDIIRSRTFDPFFPLLMAALLYFTIAWILLQGLEYLERATDPKSRRRKAGAR